MIRKIYFYTPLALTCVALYGALFMIYQPGPIDQFQRKVTPEIVRGGDSITIESIVERTHECRSIIYRSFHAKDGRVVYYDPSYRPWVPAGMEKYTAKVVVPEGLAAGLLVYRVHVEFFCNSLQDWLGKGTNFPLPDVPLQYEG